MTDQIIDENAGSLSEKPEQAAPQEAEKPEMTAGATEPAEETPAAVPAVAEETPVAEASVEPAVEASVEPAEEAAPAPSERTGGAAPQSGDEYAHSFPTLTEGEVVKGVVVHIDREGVLVDVGAKSEGIIRMSELTRDGNIPAESVVSVGDTIDVYVMQTDGEDGNLVLSKKRADFEKAWERVQEAKEQNKTIMAMVTDRVKGGLVVDLGIRGFVPASHVGSGSLKTNLDRYVGQSIPLKVLEVDKERRKVVLSNKMAADEERQSRKSQTISSLQEGQIRRGIVRRLTNYGAFIDLGGIDGLLHISEMAWSRINHPSEVLREGQELDVLILKMNLEENRISLGLRQILPDPWSGIEQKFQVGQMVTGTVTRVVPFGVFLQVSEGVEGIVPNAELSSRRGGRPSEPIKPGDTLEVKLIDLRPDERKMTLSLRQARQEEETRRERREVEEFQSRTEREEPRFTIGDALRAKEEAEGDE
jgi:ribosomal protein S1